MTPPPSPWATGSPTSSVGSGSKTWSRCPSGSTSTPFSPARRAATPSCVARLRALRGARRRRAPVTVSRFHPEKRLGTMARAELVNKRRPVAWPTSAADRWRAGSSGASARSRYPRLRLHEEPHELANALACGDAFLHGSAAETFGLVAASCSAWPPLVVPSVGGAADLANPSYAETYEPGATPACAVCACRAAPRPARRRAHGCRRGRSICEDRDHERPLRRVSCAYERRLHARRVRTLPFPGIDDAKLLPPPPRARAAFALALAQEDEPTYGWTSDAPRAADSPRVGAGASERALLRELGPLALGGRRQHAAPAPHRQPGFGFEGEGPGFHHRRRRRLQHPQRADRRRRLGRPRLRQRRRLGLDARIRPHPGRRPGRLLLRCAPRRHHARGFYLRPGDGECACWTSTAPICSRRCRAPGL